MKRRVVRLVATCGLVVGAWSALVAAASSTLWALLFGAQTAVLLSFALLALILWRHWQNIQRLRDGTEPRIGARRK